MNDNKCVHNVPIYKACATCEKEMMTDFIVHNLETFSVEEATQCIREGILTMDQLDSAIERRISHG